MNRLWVLTTLCCYSLSSPLHAHGGQFRGPNSVVPPSSSSSAGSGSSSSSAGPATPGGRASGPGASTSGASATAGNSAGGSASTPVTGGSAAPTGPAVRGTAIGADLSRWQFWWEFNKAPYLDLKGHLRVVVSASDEFYMSPGVKIIARDNLQPTRKTIRNRILPALNRALNQWDQRDITSSCMIAMAKIGMDHPDFKILPVFREQLQSRDQEIRETAALAIGIASQPDGVDHLIDLVEDNQQGRRLAARAEVDDRSRSFAAYALGLLAHGSSDQALKRDAFEPLRHLLENRSQISRNLQVAAINAIGLINPNGKSYAGQVLLEECLTTLEDYYVEPVGAGSQMIRAHVPSAFAKLIGKNAISGLSARRDKFIEGLMDVLTTNNRSGGRDPSMIQSAVLALGQLVDGSRDSAIRDKVSTELRNYSQNGMDAQARYLALISLGQIGGATNRKALLAALAVGNKALEKPWAAIALGVLVYREGQGKTEAVVDQEIGSALLHWFETLKNPDARGALAIGLGLCKYTEAAEQLREELTESKSQDEFAGYLCIGLALMDDLRSITELRGILDTSVRRPNLLRQAATALGRLGDQSTAEALVQMLTTGSQNLAKLSAVSAGLGLIGDRRSIEPLLKTLFDDKLTPLSRAFAAVALGGIADKELLPWNSKIAIDINYRAATETLTDGQSGILDIL